MATNTGSPYFIPYPEGSDPVDVAGDFQSLAEHLNNNLEEFVSDTIGVLVTGNTENGISVSVDEATNKINFDVNDPIISLSGDVSGSATMTNLSNTDIEVTIQPNSVELGVDTYGPYVATITGTENQIDVLGSSTESSDIVLSLPQDIDSTANPTFAGSTLGEIQVGITGDNEIDTATGNLTIDSAGGTTTLDDDVVITGDFDTDHVDLINDRTGYPSYAEGRLFYDEIENSLVFYDNNTDNDIHVNQNIYVYAQNNTAGVISKGKLVSCITFTEDGFPAVNLADKTIAGVPALGFAMEDIAIGGRGKVMIHGRLDGINTTGFDIGEILYLGTNGDFTDVRPSNPDTFQIVARMGKIDATDGCLLATVDPASDLVPNLDQDHIWIGDSNTQAVPTRDPNLNSIILDADLAVNGGDITTTSTAFSLADTNALTIDIGGEATIVNVGSSSGTTTIFHDLQVNGNSDVDGNLQVDGNAIIEGNLTVNGTTTTINSITYTVEDPVFVIGDPAPLGSGETPIADDKDRGIEFNWYEDTPGGVEARTGFFGFNNNTGRFAFIPDGTNTNEVFSGTLGDFEATNLYIESIRTAGGTTNINNDLDIDGDLNIDGGDFDASTSSFNILASPTTINFGAAATDIQIGSATGTTNVNNDLDVDGDLNVDGGDFTVSTSVFNLANDTATTINFAGAATDVQIGASTGTTNIKNSLNVVGDVDIDGGDLTASTTSFNLLNNVVETLNFANAATAITIGALTGTTTIRNDLSVAGNITINPDSAGPAFILGANATGQLITGLNADLLDGQTGSWYQSRDNHTGTQLHTTISDWTEASQDVVGPMFAHELHSNIIAEYNDITGQVILTAPSLPSGFGDSIGVTAAQMYWFGV